VSAIQSFTFCLTSTGNDLLIIIALAVICPLISRGTELFIKRDNKPDPMAAVISL